MGAIVERARELRRQIESLASVMEDGSALQSTELFPVWDGDSFSYTAGDRVRYGGVLYKCLQAHTSQSGWMPGAAVSLWAEVLSGQPGNEIGEWQQPDSTNPYNTGDKVLFEGKIYESLIDNNVWSPAVYPAGWQEVTE